MPSAADFLGVTTTPAPAPPPSASDFLGPPPAPKAADFLGAAPAPAASPWSLATIQQHAGPGVISSTARSAARNAAVGGSPTSSHLTNQALDFVPHDGNTARAAQALAAAGVPYDQIIDEGDHVHVGWGPKMRNQMIPRKGFGQRALDFLGGVAGGISDNLVADTGGRRQAAQQTFMSGVHDLGQGYDPAEGPLDPLMRQAGGVAKMAGGAWSYLMSPISGALQDAAGRPLEKATGGVLPKEMVGDYTDAMAGFVVPGAKGAAPVAREAAPAAEDFLGVAPKATAPEAPVKAADFLASDRGPIMAAKTEDPIDDILYAPTKRRTLTLPENTEPAPRPGAKEAITDAAGAVQSILAPATKGQGRDAAGIIRRNSAQGDLLAAQSGQTLVKHAQMVSELPVEQQRALVGYIENRSNGVRITDPALQKTADAIKQVNDTYRARIEDTMGLDDGPSFIRDYYTHMWKESPQVVEGAMLSGRQGSGRNLKARSIPTLQDGIDAGLTPLTENPIEATLTYAGNMSRYLATVQTQGELADAGMSKWAAPGQGPKDWVPLEGIRTSKPGRTIIQDGETVANQSGQQLFAPPDVARVYNNWISNGFDRGDTAGLFNPIRKITNGMTMLKLGLSAFHATTMAQEGVISEIARGYQSLSRTPGLLGAGKLGEATSAAGTGVKALAGAPGAFIGRAVRGGRMRSELLGLKAPDGLSAQVNDAFIRAGGRVRMDPLLRTRGAGSFYSAIKTGTWKSELKSTAESIFGKDKLVLDRAKGVVDLGANIIQSVAGPLFEDYIPRLKQGAFAANMEDWIKANGSATQAEIDQAAHLINRSIDNRFGEMAWDNLFWHRYLKQASQILLLSPTWNLGTINEIGGGLADMMGASAKGLVTGKGVTQRTAYVAALATFVPLINGIATYLKTGEKPKGMDFLAYRTGGTDASSGEPERALLPGYQKDVYSFGYDFPNHIGDEFTSKLSPALQTATQLYNNRDYRGLAIYPKKGAIVQPDDKGVGDYLLEQAMPISLGQLAKPDKLGSNISPAEKTLAIRPAPAYLQSPDRVESIVERNNREDWKRKTRADRRDAARRGQ